MSIIVRDGEMATALEEAKRMTLNLYANDKALPTIGSALDNFIVLLGEMWLDIDGCQIKDIIVDKHIASMVGVLREIHELQARIDRLASK